MKTATLIFDIGSDGISNLRVTANSPEDRAEALAKVKQVLPSIELLERLLSDDEPKDGRRK